MRQLLGNIAARMLSPIYAGLGSIVLFHRVLPLAMKSPLASNRDLEITPDYLESVLQFVRDSGLEAIDLDQVHDRLRGKAGKRFVCFTSDDAYIDTRDFALPLFRKYDIPLTIYATPSFHGEKPLLWWYALEDVIRSCKRLQHQWQEQRWDLPLGSPQERETAFTLLSAFVRTLGAEQRDPFLLQLCASHGVDPHQASRERLMSLAQLKQAASERGVTIGAHTMNHHVMRNLRDDEVTREISGSKLLLEQWTGKPVDHFAFPFGGTNAAGAREVLLAAGCGFKTITTTRSGTLFRRHAQHLDSLPRLNIGGLNESSNWALRAFSGFESAQRNDWRRVITL